MLKVYYYRLCPFSRKLRLILGEKGINFELKEEDYSKNIRNFLKTNLSGTIPSVTLEDGNYLYGSNALFEYFEELFPFPTLLSEEAINRSKIRSLAEWFDNKFYHEVTKHIFNEKILKIISNSHEPPLSSKIRAAKSNLMNHMNYIQSLLQDNMYLFGDRLSIADISAAAQISILDYTCDINWDQNERTKSWYALMKSRPSFREILAERVIGVNPPSYYANPDF